MKSLVASIRRLDPAAIGIAGVATAAAVLSFSSLRALAISTNTWSWIAWLLPISLDAAAATATFVWLRTERTKVARLAAVIAWATIVLSVVGNGVHHAFQALGIHPWWWVALIVGAVPPAVFGAVVHLAITAAKPDGDERERRELEPEWGPPSAVTEPPVTEPVPVTAPVRDLRPVPTGKRTRRELVAAGAPLGVKRKADELLDDFRARVEQAERDQRGAA